MKEMYESHDNKYNASSLNNYYAVFFYCRSSAYSVAGQKDFYTTLDYNKSRYKEVILIIELPVLIS